MSALSWDLHVHPGPSSTPRWGDGRQVWEAARTAGASGFVWKSHEQHTVAGCAALPSGPPFAIASASLNPWADVDSVVAALDAGAVWIWGPTCDAEGRIAWDLPLPAWWPELGAQLASYDRPLVLATGHLSGEGRRQLAETAAALPAGRCSVTHSLHLELSELRELAAAACAFELDLYTYAFPIPGRPLQSPQKWAGAVLDEGATAYVTSDGGQLQTGNPFEFAARVRPRLEAELGAATVARLCVDEPERFAREVLRLPLEAAPS
jgi:hypothetical protein